ncbi:MAG: dual specificity protein phosphatase [Thermoprotei archaeon]
MKAQLSRFLSILSSANRFDWVVDGLAVGTDNVSAETLSSNGIRCVVSVGARLVDHYDADKLFLDVEDGEPPSEEQALGAVSWVQQKIKEGKNVFVHCHAGMGRSVTLAACYLIAIGYPASEALKLLRERHPQSSPTRAQLTFLHSFESKHRGRLNAAYPR